MASLDSTGLAMGVAMLIIAATPAVAAPVDLVGGDPNISVTYYEITGADAGQIVKQIKAIGPGETPGGDRAAGLTATRFDYQWLTGPDGACDLKDAVVGYKIVVTLPKLAPNLKLRSNTGQWWLMMIDALTRHELDHVRLALGYRAEMEKAIRAAKSCDEANAEAERLHKAFVEANARYDKITDHGTWVPSGRVRKR